MRGLQMATSKSVAPAPDRDDAMLRQSKSRAAQTKFGAPGAGRHGAPAAFNMYGNVNVHMYDRYDQHDTPFSSFSDEIDSLRFNYMGTSQQPTIYDRSCHRRRMMNCMGGNAPVYFTY